MADLRVAERKVFIADGKGGRQRVVPISGRFFASVAALPRRRTPRRRATDVVFVVLKGQAPGTAAVGLWARRDPRAGQGAGRPCPWHLPRAAPHLSHPAARSGHGPRSRPGPGRPRLDRDHPSLSAPGRRLVGRRVPPGVRSHRRPGPGGGPMSGPPEPVVAARLSETIEDYLAQIVAVVAAPKRRQPAQRPEAVRRLPRRAPPGGERRRRPRAPPHRELQDPAMATSPGTKGPRLATGHGSPAAVDAADVLGAHHGMGMGRRPVPGAHLRRRSAQERRGAAQVPRRRQLRRLHAGGPKRTPATSATGHRAARPHRACGWASSVRLEADADGEDRRRPTGCASPSASSTTTATSRCTPSSSTCSRSGRSTLTAEWAGASSPTTAGRSTATPSPACATGAPRRPASATSTPTSCATPWPPRR